MGKRIQKFRRLPSLVQALAGAVPFGLYALASQSEADRIGADGLHGVWENHDSGLSYWIPSLFLTTIVIDILLNVWLTRRHWNKADTFSSVAMGLLGALLSPLIKYVQWTVFVWAFLQGPLAQGGSWVDWVVCFMAGEYLGYWFHRWGHEVNFLWAAHFTHHSSEEYNLAIGIRNNVLHIFYKFYLWIPLCWLGFHPVMVITCDVFSNVYQFFIHVNWVGRLGFLERFINTPSNHRVHHGRNPQYLDRNYGGLIMLYDHVFGTYAPEVEPVDFGLTDGWTSNNPWKLIFRQWGLIAKSLRKSGGSNWRSVLLGRPGKVEDVPKTAILPHASPIDPTASQA